MTCITLPVGCTGQLILISKWYNFIYMPLCAGSSAGAPEEHRV